jgi:hypothetical protein
MNNTIPLEDHRRIVEALQTECRLEVGVMRMQLVRYAAALEEHGIPVADADTAELLTMWRDAAAVVDTASEFVVKLGTAKELIFPMPRVAA